MSTETTTAQRPGSGRFLAGDAVRGIACVAIILYHLWGAATTSFVNAAFVKGDNAGVVDAYTAFGKANLWLGQLDVALYVFLVLSGYLIARPFIAAVLLGRPLPDLRRYARNRFVRIVPAFWVAFTVILIIWGAHGGSVVQIVAVYAFLQNFVDEQITVHQFVQGWTVGVEVMFYAFLPFAAIAATWVIRRFSLPPWPSVLAVIAGVFVAGLAIRAADTESVKYTRTFPAIGFAFAPGMLLAAIEVRYAERLRGASWGARAAWGGAVLTFLCYLAFVVVEPHGVMINSIFDVVTATGMVATPLLLQWTTGRNWFIFSNPVSVWIGSRSYSIYLYHVAISYALNDLLLRQSGVLEGFLVVLPISLIGTFIAAELSFRFVETPALRHRAKAPAK